MAHKYQQGFFRPNNPQKYQGDTNNIVYRSSWERKFLHWCDDNPSVVKWTSEELVIPYYSQADQKKRRYFVDFVVQFKTTDGNIETHMIEIKPDAQTRAPVRGRKRAKTYLQECYDWQVNKDKWTAAIDYAKKNGMRFTIMTEYDLGIAKRNG